MAHWSDCNEMRHCSTERGKALPAIVSGTYFVKEHGAPITQLRLDGQLGNYAVDPVVRSGRGGELHNATHRAVMHTGACLASLKQCRRTFQYGSCVPQG